MSSKAARSMEPRNDSRDQTHVAQRRKRTTGRREAVMASSGRSFAGRSRTKKAPALSEKPSMLQFGRGNRREPETPVDKGRSRGEGGGVEEAPVTLPASDSRKGGGPNRFQGAGRDPVTGEGGTPPGVRDVRRASMPSTPRSKAASPRALK